jgi:hypothetical protein
VDPAQAGTGTKAGEAGDVTLLADVLDWLQITEDDQIDAVSPALQRVLDAVTSTVLEHHDEPVLEDDPTDAQTARYAQRQAAWNQALIMATGRLWRRKSTPEGVLNFDAGGVIRVGSFDADVGNLLAPFEIWGLA